MPLDEYIFLFVYFRREPRYRATFHEIFRKSAEHREREEWNKRESLLKVDIGRKNRNLIRNWIQRVFSHGEFQERAFENSSVSCLSASEIGWFVRGIKMVRLVVSQLATRGERRKKEGEARKERAEKSRQFAMGMISVASPCSIQGNDFKIPRIPFDWLSPLHARVAWAAINKKSRLLQRLPRAGWQAKASTGPVEWEGANDCGLGKKNLHLSSACKQRGQK